MRLSGWCVFVWRWIGKQLLFEGTCHEGGSDNKISTNGIDLRLSNNSSVSNLFVKQQNHTIEPQETMDTRENKKCCPPLPTPRENISYQTTFATTNSRKSLEIETSPGSVLLLKCCYQCWKQVYLHASHQIISSSRSSTRIQQKLSCYCMNNVQQIISSHNKTVLTSAAENKLWNCREQEKQFTNRSVKVRTSLLCCCYLLPVWPLV